MVGGKMFGRNKVTNQEASQYAMRSDFCRIFEKDMNRLYLLSFLLTGDRTMAEQCFVGGIHIAQEENQVFKEWAESWARRAIIQNAIRMIRPRKTSDAKQAMATPNADNAFTPHAEVALVVALPAFERFVFLMSVLERYSDQECSLLLSCTRADVIAARTRALERLGKFADLQRALVSITSNQKIRRTNPEPAPQLTAVPSLAASA
jgi:DNA-directed RNA polymerase specialized sigma24 family protein